MAALLKEPDDHEWSQQTVSRAGLAKMMKAVEEPKQPTAKLRELMRAHRDEKRK